MRYLSKYKPLRARIIPLSTYIQQTTWKALNLSWSTVLINKRPLQCVKAFPSPLQEMCTLCNGLKSIVRRLEIWHIFLSSQQSSRRRNEGRSSYFSLSSYLECIFWVFLKVVCEHMQIFCKPPLNTRVLHFAFFFLEMKVPAETTCYYGKKAIIG